MGDCLATRGKGALANCAASAATKYSIEQHTSAGVLTNQSSLEQRLHISAPVKDAMNKYVLSDDLIDDTIRLEVNLPIAHHTDSIQLGWNMAAPGQFGKPHTECFQLIQHMTRLLCGVEALNVTVDVDQVLLCLLGESDAVAFHLV